MAIGCYSTSRLHILSVPERPTLSFNMKAISLVLLDRYENVASRQYERVLVCVFNYDTNSFVEATAYISKERNDNRLRPRSGYMSHLLRGADVLPLGWIDYLKSIPTVVELA
jgi:hypothetical protein